MNGEGEPGTLASRREAAIKRLKDKRDFRRHVLVYVVVNGFLVLIWLLTSPGGYFWPIWVLGGWGIGLVFHGYDAYVRRPITEADIEREMYRGRGPGV
jgi:hypothetical protein